MRNRTYGGVRGRKMTVGGKQPTSFSSYSIFFFCKMYYTGIALSARFLIDKTIRRTHVNYTVVEEVER